MSLALVALLLAAAAPGCAGARVAPPAPKVVPAAGLRAAPRWVEAAAQKAREAGAGELAVIADGAGSTGDSLGGRVEIPRESCAIFLAAGGSSLEDIDLFVYADDGTLLGADEGVSAAAAAVVCPPHPEQVYAFGRVAAGHGLLAVTVQLVPEQRADAAARAAGIDPALTERAATEQAWPGLEAALLAHRRDLGATWRELRRVAVPLDPRAATRVPVIVDAGGCTDVFVLPSDEVAFVEAVALDGSGRILGRAPEGSRPSLALCGESRTEATMELRPRAGRGLAAVVVSTTAERAALEGVRSTVSVEPGATASLADSRAALAELLSDSGHGKARDGGSGAAAVGRRLGTPIELPRGCTRIDVVGGAPLRGIDAWLWSGRGTLLAHDDGAARATLFACGERELARLDVESVLRAGPFGVELRALPNAGAALIQEPLAASRLLGRLAATGGFTGPRDLPAPKRVALSSDGLTFEDVLVPVGRCVAIAAASGPGTEGVELRLVDSETGEEVGSGRGGGAATAEGCALDRPSSLRLRVEARVVAGAGWGLLSTRLVTPPPRRAP